MPLHAFSPYLPMVLLLTWAAVADWRTRKIRNWLTFGMLLAGVGQSFMSGGSVSPADAGLGLLVGFGLTFPMFAIGAVGGGDVKLLAAMGAWLGPGTTFMVFVVEALIGLVIVLTQAAATGKLRALARNSAVVAIHLAHARDLGVTDAAATGESFRSIDRPLPFAVPVLAATLVVLYFLNHGGRA